MGRVQLAAGAAAGQAAQALPSAAGVAQALPPLKSVSYQPEPLS
jgi:hypothetical protein